MSSLHSEEYCKKRLKELDEKNKDSVEWSLGDCLLHSHFRKVLKEEYNFLIK